MLNLSISVDFAQYATIYSDFCSHAHFSVILYLGFVCTKTTNNKAVRVRRTKKITVSQITVKEKDYCKIYFALPLLQIDL